MNTDPEHVHDTETHLIDIGGTTVGKGIVCKKCGQYSLELIQTYPDHPPQAIMVFGSGNCQLLAGFLINVDKRALEIQGKTQKLHS